MVMFLMIMRLPQRVIILPILLVTSLFAVYFTPERWQYRMDFRRDGALIDRRRFRGSIRGRTAGGWRSTTLLPSRIRRFCTGVIQPLTLRIRWMCTAPHSIYFVCSPSMDL